MFQRFQCTILVLLLGLPIYSPAHDSSFATLEFIRISPVSWAFKIQTPLYGLDQSMRKFHADKPDVLKSLVAGSRAYKELIVAYIKAEFDATAFKQTMDEATRSEAIKLQLGQGRIKLNSHLSTLIFEVKGMPESVGKMALKFSYMADNKTQTNVLRLVDGERKKRYSLSASNDFSVSDIEFFNAY